MTEHIQVSRPLLPGVDTASAWSREFACILSCRSCAAFQISNLLRDDEENVPQPGYIGICYGAKRVLLVGQNPAVPPGRLTREDRPYTAGLRKVRDEPTAENFVLLNSILANFIARWPIHGGYFPLAECGLDLDQIAYCNLVRCRTVENRTPGERVASNCSGLHFVRWLDFLQPCVVVFVGKWAHDRGKQYVESRRIPFAFMNRQRSLSTKDRLLNRNSVVELVSTAISEAGLS
jgi:hypothetical protein